MPCLQPLEVPYGSNLKGTAIISVLSQTLFCAQISEYGIGAVFAVNASSFLIFVAVLANLGLSTPPHSTQKRGVEYCGGNVFNVDVCLRPPWTKWRTKVEQHSWKVPCPKSRRVAVGNNKVANISIKAMTAPLIMTKSLPLIARSQRLSLPNLSRWMTNRLGHSR